MSLRGICASLTLLTTLAATPAPSASGCKTCWAQAFAAESYARDPLFADSVGLHRYDDRLADYWPPGMQRGSPGSSVGAPNSTRPSP